MNRFVTSDGLVRARKYAIVGIAALAAVLTPPDVMSQFLLGVPLYLLYESGIIVAMIIERGRKRREAADAKREEEEERREALEEARRRAAVASVTTPQGTLPAGE